MDAVADLLPAYEVSNAPTTVESATSAALTGPLGAAAARAVAFADTGDVTVRVDVGRLGVGLSVALVARGALGPAAWPRAEEAAGRWPVESPESAHATALAEASAAPIPNAIAKPPTRPM
ncbi:hypothetical protein [Mycolicibacterium sp. P1-5]|uniref:hypothetical protein n=1 Tax=Mycolicibacterium sp. P1-5 TaxID=2024617 RepID=UPI001D1380EC|nr:hypothetical protein [Mycolicibacterium sp. P1-5]